MTKGVLLLLLSFFFFIFLLPLNKITLSGFLLPHIVLTILLLIRYLNKISTNNKSKINKKVKVKVLKNKKDSDDRIAINDLNKKEKQELKNYINNFKDSL
jgi:hypothetical protein